MRLKSEDDLLGTLEKTLSELQRINLDGVSPEAKG